MIFRVLMLCIRYTFIDVSDFRVASNFNGDKQANEGTSDKQAESGTEKRNLAKEVVNRQ
jgi:hypothetical protein